MIGKRGRGPMKFRGPTGNNSTPTRLEGAFAPIMNRLLSLIQARYHCEFRYQSFPGEMADGSETKVIYSLLTNNSSVTLDGSLLLPVRLHGQLWGFARFSSAEHLSAQQIHEIEDLIDLLLNSALMTAATLEDLDRLENEIQLAEIPDNVIRLSSFRRPPVAPSPRLLDYEELTAPTRRGFSIPCLIEARTFSDAQKMAVEIHQLSGRQIFVQWSDLSDEAKRNTHFLEEITDATILIPDIASVSQEERINLIDWLSGPRTKDCPQVIAATVIPYAELVAHGDESLRVLLRRLAVANLKMEKDFQHYLNYGVIEFFYDSLTGHSLEDRLV